MADLKRKVDVGKIGVLADISENRGSYPADKTLVVGLQLGSTFFQGDLFFSPCIITSLFKPVSPQELAKLPTDRAVINIPIVEGPGNSKQG